MAAASNSTTTIRASSCASGCRPSPRRRGPRFRRPPTGTWLSGSLAERIVAAPRLAAPAEARRRLAALVAAEPALGHLLANPETQSLALGVADHSPYLWSLVADDPARFLRLLRAAPEATLDALVAALESRRDEDEAALMHALRRAKQESALLVALADLGGVWDVPEATEALTRFADAAVGAALDFCLRRHARAGTLALDAEAADIAASCGLTVLALGKHGARELNYSSDVDLIVLYDSAAPALPPSAEPSPLFVRIVKGL